MSILNSYKPETSVKPYCFLLYKKTQGFSPASSDYKEIDYLLIFRTPIFC
ncbi:Uncharacterised protein [Segatella buccae]|uniref:Uncharacterized protein n=1 Tax=Segatella buccae TaxID=28126 RepID=A0AAQ1ZJ93_9BACT|nr:Uncharacterised protein [Segatella buccae]